VNGKPQTEKLSEMGGGSKRKHKNLMMVFRPGRLWGEMSVKSRGEIKFECKDILFSYYES